MNYDTWKLATPPEYEGRGAPTQRCNECGAVVYERETRCTCPEQGIKATRTTWVER